MNAIFEYLVVIAAIIGFGVACSVTRKGFSLSIFLVSIVIGIAILIWRDILPVYLIIVCAVIMMIILFGDSNDGENDE